MFLHGTFSKGGIRHVIIAKVSIPEGLDGGKGIELGSDGRGSSCCRWALFRVGFMPFFGVAAGLRDSLPSCWAARWARQ
jgi:hypothetical protein